MNEDLHLEKAEEYFEKNNDNLYLFSVESLYTVENPDIVEISMQRMLNDNISKEDFIFAENKIIAFFEYLYIKSEKTYCCYSTILDSKTFKKQNKKVKEIGVFTEYISSDFDNEKEIEIKDINALRGFLLVVIRFGTVFFRFEGIDIETEIDNCQSFFVKFKNNDIKDELISAANKLGINADKMNVV